MMNSPNFQRSFGHCLLFTARVKLLVTEQDLHKNITSPLFVVILSGSYHPLSQKCISLYVSISADKLKNY